MTLKDLVPPKNLTIDFKPSPKQYEVWKLLQPECPECGSKIILKDMGMDSEGMPQYKPICSHCGNTKLPKYILCGGAAGGGKSYLGSCWLVSSCIRFPEIKAIVGRKTFKSLKASTWATILTVLRQWGLEENVNYKINNLELQIHFWNGSMIMAQELSTQPSDLQYNRYGSLEATILFVDEISEIEERALMVLASRLRHNVSGTFVYPRTLMSTNPCLGWVRDRFVMDEDENPVECAPDDAYVAYSVLDNPCEEFKRSYLPLLQSLTSEEDKRRLLFGDWRVVAGNEMPAYWSFKGNIHLKNHLLEDYYNPLNPIITCWDFNVAPYMSCLLIQIDYDKKNFYILEEILGKPEDKENNSPALGRKVRDRLLEMKHLGGVVISGDPSGKSRSTQTEEGVNNYTIIRDAAKNTTLRPKIELMLKQPPLKTRLEFVNKLFEGYSGWTICIDQRCRKLTEDFVYQRKNEDGTKEKKKVINSKTKVKEEKYGHLSDCFDYACVQFLSKEWKKFRGGTPDVTTITAPVYGDFEY